MSVSSPDDEGTVQNTEASTDASALDTSNSQDGNATASSTVDDQGGKEPASVFDAVAAALKGQQAEASSSPEEGGSSDEGVDGEGKSDEDEAEPEGDPTEDELRRYHSKTRARVKKALHERDEWRGKAEEYEKSHTELQNIYGFMQQHGVDAEAAVGALELAGLVKSNPEEALKRLVPVVQQLQQAVGYVLPRDLHERVQQGYLSEQDARELSQRRAREARLTQQMEAQRQQQTAAQQRDAQQRAAQEMAKEASSLEAEWMKSDPDYSIKAPRVREKVELMVLRQGLPKSAADARQMVAKAKADVDSELSRFAPPRKEVRPLTGGAAVQSRPEPKSALEAAMAAIGQ